MRESFISQTKMRVRTLSWNVRGLNGENKREFVRILLKHWGADILVLVETKLSGQIDNSI